METLIAEMNTLDLLILLVLAGGLVRGFTTGIARQIMGVVGLVLAFVLSVKLMEPVGHLAAASVGFSPRIAPTVGFVIVFVTIQMVLLLLIRMVEAVLGALQLTPVNRALGGALGVFKAAVLLSVLFLILGYLGVPAREARAASALYGPVSGVLPRAWDFVSDRLPDVRRLSDRFADDVAAP